MTATTRRRRRPRQFARIIAGLTLLAFAGVGPHPSAIAASPPREFAALYASLETKLAEIDRTVSARWNARRGETTFATELLVANANIGEALFHPQTWPAVLLNLDRLQSLGIGGVKVAIKYPVLMPAFRRSADYLDFYRRLAGELRRRNLKVLVQMTDGFRETAFSALPVESYYADLTWERYRQEKRQMAEMIIREIRPDYLTVQNEPGTQAHNTGLPMTVQRTVELLEFVLRGLDKGGVLIGAGTGTWEDLAYAQSLARLDALDYLDMHIYPINRDYVVDRALRFAEIASRANKRLILGEAWLYKTSDQDLRGGNVAAAPGHFARDVFSFWEPLDARFVAAIVKLAQAERIEFASFFWSRYFFGYVEYSSQTAALPPGALFKMANAAAGRNMRADPPRLTQTGLMFQRLIRRGN